MALSNPIDPQVLQQLDAAVSAGDLSLVDEHARPLTVAEAAGQRCWAHLRDAVDGRVYVQELPSSTDLAQARYLELLGINV